jgi:hypothetical protein
VSFIVTFLILFIGGPLIFRQLMRMDIGHRGLTIGVAFFMIMAVVMRYGFGDLDGLDICACSGRACTAQQNAGHAGSALDLYHRHGRNNRSLVWIGVGQFDRRMMLFVGPQCSDFLTYDF